MKVCEKCKKNIPDDAIFCPYCGEKKQEENGQQILFCPECGEKIEKGYINCPKCGKLLIEKEIDLELKESATRETAGKKTEEKDSASHRRTYTMNVKELVYPKGLSKVLNAILGAIYGYLALTYLPYLNYYAMGDKVWGVVMIATCVWCSCMLLVIAFRCQKQYGRHLFYALISGEILKCILHIIYIQKISRYEYWAGTSSTRYYSIVGAVLTIILCWYTMKKEDMLCPSENESIIQILKEIPQILQSIFSDKETGIDIQEEKKIKQKSPAIIRPKTESEKILLVICSNTFLIFGILYTINIAGEILLSFEFFKLITGFLSIMVSIAIWMIFYYGKKGNLDGTGFSIVNGVMLIRFVIRVVICLILISVAIIAGAGIGECILLLIIMSLDLYYWWSIWKIFNSMKQNSKGFSEEVFVGIYPIFILSISVFGKVIMFAIASFMQSTAEQLTGTLNQYGDTVSSLAGILTNMLGLGYGYGWGQSSEFIQSILQPINEGIMGAFGYNKDPIFMMIDIVIPVLEILLLIKFRSLTNIGEENKKEERSE